MSRISPKAFAQLHNDAHLKGTRTLEGMVFEDTVASLTDFVQINDNPALEPLLVKLEHLRQDSQMKSSLMTHLTHAPCFITEIN